MMIQTDYIKERLKNKESHKENETNKGRATLLANLGPSGNMTTVSGLLKLNLWP